MFLMYLITFEKRKAYSQETQVKVVLGNTVTLLFIFATFIEVSSSEQ